MKKNIYRIIEFLFITMSFYYQNMINFANIDLYIVLALILILFNVTKNMQCNKTINLFALFFALLFSFGNLSITNFEMRWTFILIVQIIGFFFIIRRLLWVLSENVNKLQIAENNKKIPAIKFITISTIIGFLILLPYFLRFYPGIMTNDSFKQMWQIRGIIPYSNHHPWLHTLIIKLFYTIGTSLTNDVNKGVAVYSLFQMVVASISFSYVVYTLYKNNIKKMWVAIIWAFLFLLPFNAIYSITMWKDVMFSYIILVFSVFIWDHCYNNLDWTITRKTIFIILSFLMCLMRSNGLIAYLLFLIVLAAVYRSELKRLKFSILISIALVLLFKIPLMNIYNVTDPDFVESLSIPVQQVAYVIKKDEKLSQDEIKEISKIVDINRIKTDSNIPKYYTISDRVKNNVRDNDTNNYLENNKGKFLKLWINVGLKNPDEYIKAYVLQTSGYWYHNFGKYWIYSETISIDPSNKISDIDIVQTNLAPRTISNIIEKALDTTSEIYYKIWSPAMSFYIIVISLFIAIIKKQNILPYIFTIAVWLTLLIATPVSCEFRYAYSLFISFPILFLLSLKNNSSQDVRENVIIKNEKKSKGVKYEKRK